MAKKAISSAQRTKLMDSISDRLDHQLQSIMSSEKVVKAANGSAKKGVLYALNCVENGGGIACYKALNTTIPLKEYLKRHQALYSVHNSISGYEADLSNTKLPRKDPLTRVDIRAEASYLEWLQRSDKEKAQNRLELEFPYISFQ